MVSLGLGLRLSSLGWAQAGGPPQAVPQENPPAGDAAPAEQMSCSECEEHVASIWLNFESKTVCM